MEHSHKIEAVIWDLGGVIMRTEDHAPRTALAARLGLSYADLATQVFAGPESQRAQVGEIDAQTFWMWAGGKYGMAPKEFMDTFFAGDTLDQELIAAIRSLSSRYKTGLLSNAFSDLRYWIENEWKFADAFHTLVISAEVRLMKPDPAIYAHALQQLGVLPAAAVFVDDLPANVAAAQAAGMHGIHFSSRQQALGELGSLLGEG